jgi:endogenous inhibitor of DNA gyrase (YacG/DUF329 family)
VPSKAPCARCGRVVKPYAWACSGTKPFTLCRRCHMDLVKWVKTYVSVPPIRDRVAK